MPSDIVPVYEHVSTAYLVAPTKLVGVAQGCPFPEVAAKLLRQSAPPATVKTAIVVFGYETLEIRQRCVEALRNEGFNDIESIDPRSSKLSSSIFDLPLNCAIGEPVFVNCTTEYVDPFETYTMYVIQKLENGWQIIETLQQPATALSKYPSARNVVIYKNSSKAIKAEVKKIFPGLKLHFSSELSPIFHEKFIRNRITHDNLNGYPLPLTQQATLHLITMAFGLACIDIFTDKFRPWWWFRPQLVVFWQKHKCPQLN